MRFKSNPGPAKKADKRQAPTPPTGSAKAKHRTRHTVGNGPSRTESAATGTRTDGQERRERILQAATELFARQGFDETTTRQIADAAQSNIAAIKYYFGDKQGLVVAVMEAARAKIMEDGAFLSITPQEEPRESLKMWVVWVLRTARRRRKADATVGGLLIRALGAKPALVGPLAERLGAPVRANIMTLIDGLTDRKLAADARETAFAFIFSLTSNFVHGGTMMENMGITVPDDDGALDRLAERLTDFIIGGLHTMTDMERLEGRSGVIGEATRVDGVAQAAAAPRAKGAKP